MKFDKVTVDVICELARAHKKHGSQSLPNGTRNGGANLVWREQTHNAYERAKREGRLTWWLILEEEMAEAACEEEDAPLRAELIQVAAMCFKAIADIDDRNHPQGE